MRGGAGQAAGLARRPAAALGPRLAAALGLWLAAVGPAQALGRAPRAPLTGPVLARVSVRPDSARIGEPVRVRYEVRAPAGVAVAFASRPADDSLWSWREWKATRAEDTPQGVRHRLEALGLPFRTGRLPVPAPRFRVEKRGQAPITGGFASLSVVVRSVLPQGTPRPDIRGLKPALLPPWWARVPWWVLAVAASLAILAWWWRRRRRRKQAVREETAATAPPVAAHLEALAALAALASEKLPERGLWYEHQSRLIEIVRLFLERRFGTPQPGYTTRELCLHLAWRGLAGAEVERLRTLLRVADLAKFARSEPGVETARRHEAEARALVLAWAEPGASAAPAGETRAG